MAANAMLANAMLEFIERCWSRAAEAERERIAKLLISEDARILRSKYDDYPESLTFSEWMKLLKVKGKEA